MRIERARQTNRTESAGAATGPRGSGFAPATAGPGVTPSAAKLAGAVGVQGLEALLALQGAEDPLGRRRRAVARGRDMLDVLEDLRIGLLTGRISPQKLDRLSALISSDPGAAESPGLRRILDDIELRARVELAKLGRTMA